MMNWGHLVGGGLDFSSYKYIIVSSIYVNKLFYQLSNQHCPQEDQVFPLINLFHKLKKKVSL